MLLPDRTSAGRSPRDGRFVQAPLGRATLLSHSVKWLLPQRDIVELWSAERGDRRRSAREFPQLPSQGTWTAHGQGTATHGTFPVTITRLPPAVCLHDDGQHHRERLMANRTPFVGIAKQVTIVQGGALGTSKILSLVEASQRRDLVRYWRAERGDGGRRQRIRTSSSNLDVHGQPATATTGTSTVTSPEPRHCLTRRRFSLTVKAAGQQTQPLRITLPA